MNVCLGVLLAAVALWMVPAFHVKPPQPQPPRVIPQKATLQVDCTERERICRARLRMEKIKQKGTI